MILLSVDVDVADAVLGGEGLCRGASRALAPPVAVRWLLQGAVSS